jgi:O-antigen/teichoic acid export membrane protein
MKSAFLANKGASYQQIANRFRPGAFMHSLSIIAFGTVAAQMINVALMPIVSRLFTNSDFGLFGSYNAILDVFAAASTLQFSQAIVLPKEDARAANVFVAALLSVVAVSLLGIFVVLGFSGSILEMIDSTKSWQFLMLIPLGIFLTGLNQTFQAWCVRRKAFQRTSISQVVRAGCNSTLQVIAGLFHFGGSSLVCASLGASGCATFYLAPQAVIRDKALILKSVTLNKIQREFREFREFPFYATPQNVMNAMSQGLPVLLLAYFYGAAIAGSYAFSVRVLRAPMNLVLTALKQALFQKSSEVYNRGESLWYLYSRATASLALVAILPCLLLFICAPRIFVLVFGENWRTAGIYARWLTLWLFVGFCNLPSVLAARILRQQRNLLLVDALMLFARGGVLIIGGSGQFSAIQSIIAFSLTGFIINLLLIIWVGTMVRHSQHETKFRFT